MPPATASGERPEPITPDDPSELTAGAREVQVLAGRASIYAMLGVLAVLLIDAKILGSLEGGAADGGRVQFYLLLGSAALKLFLAQRTYRYAREASTLAARVDDTVYWRNGRGALIATALVAIVSVLVLVFVGRQAF